ncbi:ubiquitin carboxyl-terminal hydrolase 15-like [Canna indica]|uniref:ubiquitinyl hydrolase 1 n=1 Tax=Canna indica TaxID=4628 RepID=A0AAQ3Q6G5_9LILI|nr:ubiquitin carboxyl-terminal hydrolase 15-like [Canna indica]
MLQPREADIPALFIFLVVIPLFTYILLGRWNEATKKKARISILAQLAAEEAFQVEAMASADVLPVLPSSRTGLHECARCFAPATTRCSKCKSVRYCSGKCQIIHWRQGHKHECLQLNDSPLSVSAGLHLKDTVQHNPFLNNHKSPYFCNGIQEPLHQNLQSDMDDSVFMTTDTYQDSDTGRRPSDKCACNKLKMAKSSGDDNAFCSIDQDYSHDACAQASSTNHFTEIPSEDALAGHKLSGGNFTVLSSQNMNQEINCSSNSRNMFVQHSKSAGETRKGLKQSGSPVMSSQLHLDKRIITECQSGVNISSEKADSSETSFSSHNETIHVTYPAERPSAKESIMYRKPPYTLGHTASSQKSAENISKDYLCQGVERTGDKENGSRIQQNISSNIHLERFSGNPSIEGRTTVSKKTSKVLKRNLVGLINDNKKNKLCQMLFPYEDLVKFFQCEEWHISPRGLLNCGNSCYANAVLQCLTGTKPLMVYLLRRLHSRTCCVKEWCLMCELEQHVSMLREEGGPLSPSKILSNMRNIGCRMGGGNQEDAHEFLRLLVMSMQSVCLEGLGGENEVDPRLQETTLIQQIFGGRLKSKVKCLRCCHESERCESIMDLTLEIHGWVESLEDALTQFTAPEDLDGENMYRCGRCLAYVKARKQLSLHEVPNILTIVLKRFQTGKYGKINKCVTFPDMLDMIPFVTGTADNPPLYLLYAVVVHLDNLNASFAGHYISYVKDLEGTWFRIDDSEVQAVPPSQVMSEGAYMLFYSRSFPRPPQAYTDKRLSRPPICTKRNMAKSQKTSRHGQQRVNETLYAAHLRNELGKEYGEDITDQVAEYISRPLSRNILPDGTYRDAPSMEFSDATSSDWSLFTSSDDSSFTTESTRDSFSTADHGDNTTLETISSIFSPFYAPEYVNSNTISCAKFTPTQPQTRFFSESTSCVADPSLPMRPLGGVHKGRYSEHTRAPSTEPLTSASHFSLYGQ